MLQAHFQRLCSCSRWRKQSYLKHRLQNSVWKECRLCSRCTERAFGPSMFGVHSGGKAPGSCCSVNSLYLTTHTGVDQLRNTATKHRHVHARTQSH